MPPLGINVLAAPCLAFIEGLGGMEMLLIFVIVLMLFGGDKLPEFARGLGKTMREFKKAASGVEEEFKRAMEEDERKRSTTAAATSPNLTAGTDPASSSYPEDGSNEYGSEAGPTAATVSPTPANGTADAVPAADTAATSPTPEPAPGTETKPAPIPPAPPIKNEDYP